MAKRKRVKRVGRYLKATDLRDAGACPYMVRRFRKDFGAKVFVSVPLINRVFKSKKLKDEWGWRGYWLNANLLPDARVSHDGRNFGKGGYLRWARAFIKYGPPPKRVAW